MEGWDLDEIPDQPVSLRSPQERNLLQFSPFAGFGDGPPSSMGRFRRVMTTVSGSNGPSGPANLAFRQLSQLSSGNSADGSNPSTAGENFEISSSAIETPKLERQDANDEVDREECAGDQSGSNGAFPNSPALSLNQAALDGKQSYPRRNTQKEASHGDGISDRECSQITGHSKHGNGEYNSSAARVSSGGEADSSTYGSGGLKGATVGLTKRLSQDAGVIRKISGMLSRSKHEKTDSQSEAKNETECGPRISDQRMEEGVPSRNGSLLGMIGRKEKLQLRKRPFLKSPKRKAGRNKIEDRSAQAEEEASGVARENEGKKADGALSEKEIKESAALNGSRGDGEGRMGTDDDIALTEGDLAKRAVQIDKFLNSVAFH